MLGLWKTKKQKGAEEKHQLKAIVTEDLLGASEWKESKVGYLTGLSTVGRIASSAVGTVAQSFGRTSLVYKILTKSDDLPALPEVDESTYDGRLRFMAAMRLHRRNESDIKRSIGNTWRLFYFWASLAVIAIVWLVVDHFILEKMPITTLMLHLAPIPLLSAYAFKAAVTNWEFRHKRLENPWVFLKSGDLLPKK